MKDRKQGGDRSDFKGVGGGVDGSCDQFAQEASNVGSCKELVEKVSVSCPKTVLESLFDRLHDIYFPHKTQTCHPSSERHHRQDHPFFFFF